MTEPEVKILIIDDDLDLSKSLAIILKHHGFRAITAEGGHRAIEAVSKDDFELILIDMVMPEINGLETLKKLKELAPKSQMVMMTGFAVAGLVGEAIKIGVDGVLFKPFDVDVVVKGLISRDPIQLFEGYLQTIWARIAPVIGESTAQMVFSKSVDAIILNSGVDLKGIEVTEGGFSLEGLRSQIKTDINPGGSINSAADLTPYLKRLLGEVFDLLGMLTGDMLTEPLIEALDKELKAKKGTR
jgi:ActR/RegA family two-component response regulator